MVLSLKSEKLVRKQVRRERIERQHHEISRLHTVLRLNTVLAGLSHDSVKSDFLTGKHGAAVSLTFSSLVVVQPLVKQLSRNHYYNM